MRSTSKITTLGAALAAVLLLGACSNEPTTTGTSGQTNAPATNESTPSQTGTGDPAMDNEATASNGEASTTEGSNASAENATDSGQQATEASATRPATQTFELMMKGTLTKYEAKLQQGNGYSMYVFDSQTLDQAKNRLQLTANPEYYVDIKKLDSKANIDELRKEGKAALKPYGEAKEYSGDQLYESPMAPAKLYLQVSSEKGTYDYIVWEAKDGSQYTFLKHSPEGEEAEAFGVPASTALSTIEAAPSS